MDLTLTSTCSNYSNRRPGLKAKLDSTFNALNSLYNISGDQSEMLFAHYLKKIDCDDLHLVFKNKFKIYIYFENGYYFSDIDDFDIHAYGETVNELLNNINENFNFIWNNIVKIDDENLNPVAIEFKKRVLDLLSEK